jgi:carbon monoxide dehydrogenase subunit G
MAVIEGDRHFDGPPERVFELLTSPDVIASAMPAMRGHTVTDRDHWVAKVKPPVPLAPSVTIRFEVLERRPPSHAALRARGGGADVSSTFELVADGDGTRMHWRTELHLTGLLGRLGGGGLDAVARRQAERTLDAVERAL